MELYEFYNIIASTLKSFFLTMVIVKPDFQGGFSSYGAWLGTSLAIASGIWLALFLLQSFGLYYMAKKQNLEKRYLAFIPFANTLYMSKLAGKCSFFGRRMKYAGVYAMVSQILCAVVCGIMIVAEMYLYIACKEFMQIENITQQLGERVVVVDFIPRWDKESLLGFSKVMYYVYYYSFYIISIFEFAYTMFMIVVVMALFKKYAPKNYFILSILSFFIPASRYIIIFVLKKKQPIDYDDWMRRRRADFFYRQQQANPYNNPYGSPYGTAPNGQNWQNGQNAQGASQNTQSAPSDPFEEFSSNPSNTSGQSGNSGANTQTGTSGGSGDFFD